MTYQESLDYLYGLQKFGIKLGLENIRTFLSLLGHPEKEFKTVLVAGTNGKGSVASALAEMTRRSGIRTGLYTSPHLHSFSERIRVDGAMIPEEGIARLVAEMRPLAASLSLTFFEFTTALALVYFAGQGVELAILEVGLGGRLDSTNAVDPVLSVITPIANDHQEHLGDTLAQISREKAGIMRAGIPVVSSRQCREVSEALNREAERVGTTVLMSPDDFDYSEQGDAFDYHGIHLVIPGVRPGVEGRHQFGNMTTALAAAEMLGDAGFPVTGETMQAGVESMTWPGRLEWFHDRSVLLDGAHNGAAANVLARYLGEQGIRNVRWIVGMKADKNVREILAPIAPYAAEIYSVEPPVEEAVPVEVLRSEADRIGCPARSFATPENALRTALEESEEKGIILVAGSLFLVSAIRELLLREGDRSCGE